VRRLLAWLLTSCAANACAAAPDRPADYAVVAPIAASAPDGLQRLALPLSVLQQSRSADLADLRIFNAANESLPLALIPPRAEAATRDAPLPLFRWPAPPRSTASAATPSVRVRVDAHGAVVRIDGVPPAQRGSGQPGREWLLDASARRDEERLAAVTLHWARDAQGLTRKATLEGSDDLQSWRTLAVGTLFDMPSNVSPGLLRNRLVPTDDAPAPKYLRLRLDDELALRGAQAQWRSAPRLPLDAAMVRLERAQDTSGGAAWEVDLQAAIAVKQIQVALPQANTVLVVALEQRRHTDSAWRSVGRHTLYRLARDGTEVASPAIEVAGPAARHGRLRLDHPSSKLDAPALNAHIRWPGLGLVFVSRGPAPLQLSAGRELAAPAALPLATLMPDYRAGAEAALPVATLGAMVRQVPVQPTLMQRITDASPQEQRRWLLWLVLAGAVAGLAWLARGLLRDVKTGVTRD
jgi:hypothetical protein